MFLFIQGVVMSPLGQGSVYSNLPATPNTPMGLAGSVSGITPMLQ